MRGVGGKNEEGAAGGESFAAVGFGKGAVEFAGFDVPSVSGE